jgi:hypothetical protein
MSQESQVKAAIRRLGTPIRHIDDGFSSGLRVANIRARMNLDEQLKLVWCLYQWAVVLAILTMLAIMLPHVIVIRSARALARGVASIGTPRAPGDSSSFPKIWELFPILLSRSVRTRVYEPAHEELKEDYIRERARWTGPIARRWVTFCFTARTACMVGQSLWACLGGKAKTAIVTGLGAIGLGRLIPALREKVFEWFGRLL